MKNKLETRLETRAVGEIRGHTEEGICEAYLTKWNAVDSWRTQFEPGSFIKSMEKRGSQGVRLIWNHRELCGKILELREDDYGPWAKVKFNLETRSGKEAYEHVKAGDVDCFSFGFNTLKDHWVKGIRSIQEVDLMECGPVVFQANDEAVITAVRAIDFDQTVIDSELSGRGYKLLDALYRTIDDIYWGYEPKTPEEIISLIDTAISQFHTAYMTWLGEYYSAAESRTGTREGVPPRTEARNLIQAAVEGLKSSDLTSETVLTTSDLDRLKNGLLLDVESRSKLAYLPEVLVAAHKTERRKRVEELCTELRMSGFDSAETDRFAALLQIPTDLPASSDDGGVNDEMEKTISFLKDFRAKLL